MVCVYAQLSPAVHCPALAALSIDTSSEPSWVSLPSSRASNWSIEVLASTSVSFCPPLAVPVRNDAEAPACT